MSRIYLSLGSNLGNRTEYLEKARRDLANQVGDVIAVSSTYETAPWGGIDQPFFYNQVAEIQTNLEPHALLAAVQTIENKHGRTRQVVWGERSLDIDIIVYGDLQLQSPSLTLPHPLYQQRRFVLMPLVEIAPDFVDPVSGDSIRVLLEKCKDELSVQLRVPSNQRNSK